MDVIEEIPPLPFSGDEVAGKREGRVLVAVTRTQR